MAIPRTHTCVDLPVKPTDPNNPESARLLAEVDWSRTPLGPFAQWPAELKTLARLMVRSKSPQHIVWGPEQILLYNDGYIPVLGDRHPAAFGMRFGDVWPDIWDGVEPIVRRTYQGVADYFENHPWLLDRGNYKQQVWISFAYTPIESERGDVLGFHCTFHETTSAVLAQREREQELDRWRAMFEQAPGFIALLTGPDHVFTLCNAAYTRLIGGRDVTGTPLAVALPEAIEQGFGSLLDTVFRTGERFVGSRVPFEVELGEGRRERRYVDFVYQPVRDANGQVTCVFVEGSDVTTHHAADQELRRATDDLVALAAQRKLALDAARLGWWQFTPATGNVTHDERYAEIYGIRAPSPHHVDEITRLIHPEDAPRVSGVVNAALHSGESQPYAVEYRIHRPDGEVRWLEARGIATLDGEGGARAVAHLIGTVADITERRQADEVLRENEARFRLMADASPAALWLTDPGGSCTFLSRQWYELTGQTEEEALGLGWTTATHPDDQEAAGQAFLDANHARRFFQTEYRLRTADGSYRWAIDLGRPWYSEAGEYAGMVGVVFDIDARKRAEQAVEDASRRKDQFLATLAHELRNPLAPISNALQVWPLLEGKPEEAARLREMVGRQVRQMIRLIDDLLDVSRITRGKIALRKERLDLRGVLAGAVEAQKPLLESRRHHFEIEVPGDAIPVDADTGRLVQVFGNLLHNAAKYTSPGGRISLRASREGAWAVVSLRDNGTGIPAEMLSAIFDMFTQVDQSLDRADGGLGIGLTLVRNLVDLHGGVVEARSDGPGHGSEFIVRLPVAADDQPAMPAPPASDARPNPPRRRILVVDDVEPSANTLSLMLEALGQTPKAVYDGMSALEAMRTFEPDIVFLDIAMPGMDGYELARRIRKTWTRPLLVALTGYGQEEDRRRAFDAGFDHHLIKPTHLDALRALLAPNASR